MPRINTLSVEDIIDLVYPDVFKDPPYCECVMDDELDEVICPHASDCQGCLRRWLNG